MREIKYRAWLKNQKIIVDVQELHFYNNTMAHILDNYIDGEQEWIDEDFDDYELIQYTGLKDENGVEIYEGDIVENGNGKVGYILFQIQAGGFVVVIKDRDYRIGHRNNGEGYHTDGNHKVIGNIYISPELLENN